MGNPRYKLTDEWFEVSPGGTWADHVARGDQGVDFLMPKGTPLKPVYEVTYIKYDEFKGTDGLGTRKICVMAEVINGKMTSNTTEIWHISKLMVKEGIYHGKYRQTVALSGKSGATGYHGHCKVRNNGKPNPKTLELIRQPYLKDYIKLTEYNKLKKQAENDAKSLAAANIAKAELQEDYEEMIALNEALQTSLKIHSEKIAELEGIVQSLRGDVVELGREVTSKDIQMQEQKDEIKRLKSGVVQEKPISLIYEILIKIWQKLTRKN